ncbi:uncharacterized protein MELLADRAFT_63808 [Melampsora larici-populina 98AG31]|uniref:Uncharacterized protein n=1 Tax=Melampsora larici-populina (strain 98AG31 / pathotype 3-4-7) TaxID=747676 RepID=F4RP78_MELLP|nr:uncharacterized protein MELLADRAFT_63808 [Melampsora larici-populina 98AG31]EGG05769.1 hypothetical protein MELLADRAFT_63808 [Melampsora larici-populina 98AG31]
MALLDRNSQPKYHGNASPANNVTLPAHIQITDHTFNWTQSRAKPIKLENFQVVHEGTFVLVRDPNQRLKVALIKAIWTPAFSKATNMIFHLETCTLSHSRDAFYGMRGLNLSGESIWLYLKHNCFDSSCQVVTPVRESQGLRYLTKLDPKLEHARNGAYILNTLSLHSATSHRQMGSVQTSILEPAQRVAAIASGIALWQQKKVAEPQNNIQKHPKPRRGSKAAKRGPPKSILHN